MHKAIYFIRTQKPILNEIWSYLRPSETSEGCMNEQAKKKNQGIEVLMSAFISARSFAHTDTLF